MLTRNHLFLALITLAFIFLICSKDRYSTPLNFDTFFGLDSSSPFSRRVNITQRGEKEWWMKDADADATQVVVVETAVLVADSSVEITAVV